MSWYILAYVMIGVVAVFAAFLRGVKVGTEIGELQVELKYLQRQLEPSPDIAPEHLADGGAS